MSRSKRKPSWYYGCGVNPKHGNDYNTKGNLWITKFYRK